MSVYLRLWHFVLCLFSLLCVAGLRILSCADIGFAFLATGWAFSHAAWIDPCWIPPAPASFKDSFWQVWVLSDALALFCTTYAFKNRKIQLIILMLLEALLYCVFINLILFPDSGTRMPSMGFYNCSSHMLLIHCLILPLTLKPWQWIMSTHFLPSTDLEHPLIICESITLGYL